MTADLEELSLTQLAETLAHELDRREDALERDLHDVRTFRTALANVKSAPNAAEHVLTSVPPLAPVTPTARASATKTRKVAKKAPVVGESASVRSYTNWRAIHQALLDGETDEYVTTLKTSSAASTKSNLARQFPDLAAICVDNNDGTTTITVELGDSIRHAVAS